MAAPRQQHRNESGSSGVRPQRHGKESFCADRVAHLQDPTTGRLGAQATGLTFPGLDVPDEDCRVEPARPSSPGQGRAERAVLLGSSLRSRSSLRGLDLTTSHAPAPNVLWGLELQNMNLEGTQICNP